MIDTVIFDIGNVLIRFSWWEYILADHDDDTADRITDAVWRHGLWTELDRGVIPVPEVLQSMEDLHPEVRQEIRDALAGCGRACHRQDYAIPWIRELKQMGYRVLFLSNYSEWLMERNPDVLDFLPEMDGGVFSCRVKQIKPDAEIYRIICETYDLDLSHCLFIDDNAANVAASNAFGLPAVQFLGYEESRPVIMERLRKERE